VKFLIDNWMLMAVALASGGMLLWPVIVGGARGGALATAEAVTLINREKAVVIDVCGADEYATGHVAGAKNVPLDELEAKLPSVVKNKATPLILVCARGNRSQRAVALAKKAGFENAHSLAGGTAAWRAANLPIEKT
jgi:rhodanese-related sulfurtransferase